MKQILLFAALMISSLTAFSQCTYTLTLTDTWGDGWNGSFMTVNLNGNITNYVLDETNGTTIGEEWIIPITANTGDNLSVTYNWNNGGFTNEQYWQLEDPNGSIIASDGPDPVDGFGWTGTTSCPSCFSPSNIAVNFTSFSTAEISFIDGNSPIAPSYNFEYGPSGFTQGTGTMLSGGNPTTISGLSSILYDVYVQTDCNGDLSDWSGPVSFYGYCIPAPSSVDGDGIVNVNMGSINNSTGAEPGNYGNYTAFSADAPQGEPLTIDITLETGYDYYLWAWVDWNNDLDFTDPGEEYYLGESTADVPTTYNALITVPATASLGNHVIRIGGSDSGLSNTSPSDPCYTGSYAAFEDYTLNVIPPLSCGATGTPTVTNITAFDASVSWVAQGSETVWDIEVVPSGTQPTGTPTYDDVTMSPFPITGLSPITEYTVYIRADCGMDNTDVSVWLNTSFVTPCSTFTPYYIEDFTDMGFNTPPPCWEEAEGGNPNTGPTLITDSNWTSDDFGNLGLSNSAKINIYFTGNSEWLLSPQFDLTTGGPFEAKFDFSIVQWNTNDAANLGSDDEVHFLISDDGGTTWTALQTWTAADNIDPAGETLTFDLSSYDGNIIQFAFWATNGIVEDEADNDIFIDNFIVKIRPQNDMSVSNIIAPQTGCGMGLEDITIELFNAGYSTQGGFFVNYAVNGVVQAGSPDGFVASNINSAQTTTYTFNTPYDFSTNGDYVIQAWPELPGEEDVSNDTFTIVINNSPAINSLPYNVDFETGDGGFFATNESGSSTTVWTLGTPAGGTINTANSGTNAFATNLTGFYGGNTLTYLNSPCFDFSSYTVDPEISFAFNLDSETDYDGFWLEISLDGGNTWGKLGNATDPSWYSVSTVSGDEYFQGNSGGWMNTSHSLDGTAGSPAVKFRFVFLSDGAVSDFDGAAIDDISITDVCALGFNVSADITDETTANISLDGEIIVTPTTGSTPFAYNWSNGATNDTITGLETGTYVVTITDAAGCMAVETYMVGSICEGNFIDDISYTPETQNTVTSDGSITVTANSVPPYTFEWSTGDNSSDPNGTSTLSNLPADVYSVTITDGAGCQAVSTIVVTSVCPVNLASTYNASDETIEGASDGSITVNPTSGSGPYSYNWSSGGTSETETGLAAGSYSVTITDANGCEEILTVDLIATCPSSLGLSASATDESIQGASDGTASASTSAGAIPFSYEWNNGETGNTIINLAPGTYTVTVTDNNGCQEVNSVTVNQGSPPVSIDEIDIVGSLALAPNPTKGISYLDIRFTQAIPLKVDLVSLVGQVLSSYEFDNTSGENIRLDISDVPSGIYFIRLNIDGQIHTERLVKSY